MPRHFCRHAVLRIRVLEARASKQRREMVASETEKYPRQREVSEIKITPARGESQWCVLTSASGATRLLIRLKHRRMMRSACAE